MKNNGWDEKQQAFLDGIYRGVEDPDAKISLLEALIPNGNRIIVTSTDVSKDGRFEYIPSSRTSLSTRIGVLEYEVLIQEGLFVPGY